MSDSLFDYLDAAYGRKPESTTSCTLEILESPMPPCGYLDEEESAAFNRRLKNALSREGTVGDSVLRARMKLLLAGLFYDGFMQDRYMDQPPEWMLDLCREYEEKQLFVEGYAALVRLSGKTTAYLSRCFRRYYHTTPTGYVNFLRVGLAAKLLEEEELRIIDICYRCGFDNTSNFYLYFKERYGMSPGEYRAHVCTAGTGETALRET